MEHADSVGKMCELDALKQDEHSDTEKLSVCACAFRLVQRENQTKATMCWAPLLFCSFADNSVLAVLETLGEEIFGWTLHLVYDWSVSWESAGVCGQLVSLDV